MPCVKHSKPKKKRKSKAIVGCNEKELQKKNKNRFPTTFPTTPCHPPRKKYSLRKHTLFILLQRGFPRSRVRQSYRWTWKAQRTKQAIENSMIFGYIFFHTLPEKKHPPTVDGRNPANHLRCRKPCKYGRFSISTGLPDIFHQQ